MRIESVVYEDWAAPGQFPGQVVIATSEKHKLYINYDKQILIVTPEPPNGSREIIPLARVYSILETDNDYTDKR